MADGTGISWSDATWPVVAGCDPASPGCDHCYAARLTSGRLKHLPAYQGLAVGGKFTGEVRTLPDRLDWPLKWKKPRRIFVSDMADLFHPDVPDGFIAQVWDVMARCPQHTFQILSKRHARMRSWVTRWADTAGDSEVSGGDLPPMPRGPDAIRATYTSGRAHLFAAMLDQMGEPPEGCAYPLYDWMQGPRWWPSVLPNVWMGCSVEDQHWADIRIPALLDTPAAVRFISAEPLLGPVDLLGPLDQYGGRPRLSYWLHGRPGWGPEETTATGLVIQPLAVGPRLDWVIVGGESGPGARPMHPAWARTLRNQCQAAGVAFHFKQWGEWGPAPFIVRVCDPAIGWTGTAEELVEAKRDAEAQGATHVHTGNWRMEDGRKVFFAPHEIGHPCWGLERVALPDEMAAIRRWGKKAAGRELDGRIWDEYPQAVHTNG